jgi:hypothetical protein
MKTVEEIRYENLIALLENGLTIADMAAECSVSAAYLSQIKTKAPNSRTMKQRHMGKKMAREIERGLGLEHGWMDKDHAESDIPKLSLKSAKSNSAPMDAMSTDLLNQAFLWLQQTASNKKPEHPTQLELGVWLGKTEFVLRQAGVKIEEPDAVKKN